MTEKQSLKKDPISETSESLTMQNNSSKSDFAASMRQSASSSYFPNKDEFETDVGISGFELNRMSSPLGLYTSTYASANATTTTQSTYFENACESAESLK